MERMGWYDSAVHVFGAAADLTPPLIVPTACDSRFWNARE